MPQDPTLQPYDTDDDMIADLQRQCGIIEAARWCAEARDEHPPLSGMPGSVEFNVAALAAAGETYRIVAGAKIPLTP
jgi:hypothetical protein